MPQAWIVGVQLYRALGVVFLILYAAGQLPGLFAWPAGVGDIAIGLSAPLVGYAYARAPRETAGVVRAWNVLGILDLVVAVTTGFLTAPSLITPIEVHPTSELMTMLPMVMIPVYLVPLSIVLHIASLVKLHRDEARATNGRGACPRGRLTICGAQWGSCISRDAGALPIAGQTPSRASPAGGASRSMKAATSQACCTVSTGST